MWGEGVVYVYSSSSNIVGHLCVNVRLCVCVCVCVFASSCVRVRLLARVLVYACTGAVLALVTVCIRVFTC